MKRILAAFATALLIGCQSKPKEDQIVGVKMTWEDAPQAQGKSVPLPPYHRWETKTVWRVKMKLSCVTDHLPNGKSVVVQCEPYAHSQDFDSWNEAIAYMKEIYPEQPSELVSAEVKTVVHSDEP